MFYKIVMLAFILSTACSSGGKKEDPSESVPDDLKKKEIAFNQPSLKSPDLGATSSGLSL